MKEALRPLVEASASGIREIARAGFHAGASWALLPSCPAAPPCPPYPPCPACFCTCGGGGGGGGDPAGGGGGGSSPPWLAAAGGPVCDALADALVGALREAVEGCVGWGAAIALVLLALLAGFGLGRISLAASARLEPRDGAAVVRYAGDDLWHERILLYPAASEAAGAGLPGACWVVYTPDHDMYIEELEGGSPDDSPVEWLEMPRDLRLPSGLGRAYRFEEVPTEEVMKGLYRRAYSAAQADAESRGVLLETPVAVRTAAGRDVAVHEALGANFFGGRRMTGKRPPLGLDLGGDHGGHAGPAAAAAEGLGDSGAPGPAVEGTSTPRSSGRVWRAAEADERCRIALGDELGPPAHSLCGKGLCLAAPGRAVVVHLTGLDQDSFVMSLRGGEGREWREVVDACEEEPFGDFPVAGPRSAWWCLDFLRRRHTPTDHHPMFKTTARLQSEQWGVQEHEQLMKYIELAGTYDRLDLSNCAFAEATFRRAQTIEWSYHDRLREADSASSKDKMSPEEFSAFSGFSKAGDLLMVAPTLLEFAKGQVEKGAAIMKNIRKAREERELRRKGALRELRGAGVYEDIDSPVVSFDDSLVSLPEAGNVPVPLGELVAGVGDLDVEAAIHEQLLPRKDAESNLSEAPRQPYMDAILRAQPHAYAGLVRRLHTAGMVTFSAAPRERCGLFFVRKKSGKQRMVIDCRRANCWFRRPSTVAVATGSALGELAVPEGEQLYVGHVDICDAFYHFGLPEAFRDYFALPAVKAGDVGLTVLGGRPLAPGSRAWPVLAVLPMGWSHALYWCQTIHRGIVSSIPALLDVPFISDKSVAPPVQPLAMTIYVDNFLALGTDPEAVSRAVKLVNAALTSRGSVYTFIRRLGHCTAVPLWESVRWELNAFSSLLCLISRKLQVSWSSKVMCTDASFWGFGLVCKDLDKDLVGSMGCFSERWRFLGDSKALSRAWAAGPSEDEIITKPLESSKDFQQFVGDEEASKEARTRAAGRLPEAVREEGWAVVGSHKWGSPPGNIVEGEARAIAFGVKHICRSTKAFECHHLLLSDSLSSVLALGKGRSSAPGVSGALRSVAAHVAATGLRLSARWLPSEWNFADGPSRGLRHAGYARAGVGQAGASPGGGPGGRGPLGPEDPPGAAKPGDVSAVASEARAPPAADKVKRRKLARRGAKLADAGTLDVLRLSTVRTQTARSRCQQLAAELDEWLAEQGLPARPTFSLDERRMIPLAPEAAAELDCSLAEWMLGQYLEGVDHWRGVQMLAALQWSDPRLGRDGGARLPGARQSLRGWKVLTPPLTRLPLPEEVVAALACELVSMGLWEVAACVVLSMVFYMRPGEWGRVRVKHAIAPRASGSQALRQWALVLHPRDGEEARPSKTAEFDESLVLDLTCDLWLGGVLRSLTAAKPPDAALFSFSVEEFAEIFRRAVRRLGLEPAPMPCLLRHAGASRDFVNGLRPLSEVKRRGRWKTDASVRRYEKGGRLSEQFAKLPPALQKHALRCHSVLPEVLLGGLAAPPFLAR
ncbi:unnamed protein product [Prorocentrum cordatum]|uniref:Reverse transcriptase domain-containing protein n=1 Tax=Prorocentrum cordatum TaxID=2364126 RepID=A0ABN9UC59_9DINO|nr:unnamed protein product [Polarella glacialis]